MTPSSSAADTTGWWRPATSRKPGFEHAGAGALSNDRRRGHFRGIHSRFHLFHRLVCALADAAQDLDELCAAAMPASSLIERNPRFFAPLPGRLVAHLLERPRPVAGRDSPDLTERRRGVRPLRRRCSKRHARSWTSYILRRPPSWAEVAAEFTIAGRGDDLPEVLSSGRPPISPSTSSKASRCRPSLARLGLIGTFRGPRDAGTGYVKLYHSMGMATGNRGRWTYVRGAMGSITQALIRQSREQRGVDDPHRRRGRADLSSRTVARLASL